MLDFNDNDLDLYKCMIDLLLDENNILQKKINNEKLTRKEEIFCSFVSPSLIIKSYFVIKNRKEAKNNESY